MTKRLYVRYGDLELIDAEVEEFGFSESDSGSLSVSAKLPRAKTAAGMGGFLEALTGARRQSTAQLVQQKRAEYQAETEVLDADTQETP